MTAVADKTNRDKILKEKTLELKTIIESIKQTRFGK